MLEIALTLPMLLLVCVGIFEFGRAYQTWQVLTNAAREGARVAVLSSSTPAQIEDRVKDYLRSGQLSEWDAADVVIDQTATISIGATNASASIVTVDYPFSFTVLRGVARLVSADSSINQNITLSASAEMRNETQ